MDEDIAEQVRSRLRRELDSIAVAEPDVATLTRGARSRDPSARVLTVAAALAGILVVAAVALTLRPAPVTVLDAPPPREEEPDPTVATTADHDSTTDADPLPEAAPFEDTPGEVIDGPVADPEEESSPEPTDVLEVPLPARFGHTVTWTGEEVVVWGGELTNFGSGSAFGDGARFDPGSGFGDGARFDPDTSAWRPMAPAPVAETYGHLAVWTGSEVLMVGGRQDPTQVLAYDPVADTWAQRAPAPFAITSTDAAIAWTGGQLLAWLPAAGMAAYDPVADAWEPVAAPPGTPGELVELRLDTRTVPTTVVAVVGADGARDRGSRGIEVAVRQADGAWRPGPDLDRLIDVAETFAEFPIPRYTSLTDAGLLVVPSQGAPIPAALWDLSGTWVDLPTPPKPSCEDIDSPIQVAGDIVVGNYCGPGVRFDASTLTFEPFEPVGPVGLDQVIWTGEELIAVVGTCCDGTPASGAVWASWRTSLPDGP